MALRPRALSTNDNIQLVFGILTTTIAFATLMIAMIKLWRTLCRSRMKLKNSQGFILPMHSSPRRNSINERGNRAESGVSGLEALGKPRRPSQQSSPSFRGRPRSSPPRPPQHRENVEYWIAESRTLRFGRSQS